MQQHHHIRVLLLTARLTQVSQRRPRRPRLRTTVQLRHRQHRHPQLHRQRLQASRDRIDLNAAVLPTDVRRWGKEAEVVDDDETHIPTPLLRTDLRPHLRHRHGRLVDNDQRQRGNVRRSLPQRVPVVRGERPVLQPAHVNLGGCREHPVVHLRLGHLEGEQHRRLVPAGHVDRGLHTNDRLARRRSSADEVQRAGFPPGQRLRERMPRRGRPRWFLEGVQRLPHGLFVPDVVVVADGDLVEFVAGGVDDGEGFVLGGDFCGGDLPQACPSGPHGAAHSGVADALSVPRRRRRDGSLGDEVVQGRHAADPGEVAGAGERVSDGHGIDGGVGVMQAARRREHRFEAGIAEVAKFDDVADVVDEVCPGQGCADDVPLMLLDGRVGVVQGSPPLK